MKKRIMRSKKSYKKHHSKKRNTLKRRNTFKKRSVMKGGLFANKKYSEVFDDLRVFIANNEYSEVFDDLKDQGSADYRIITLIRWTFRNMINSTTISIKKRKEAEFGIIACLDLLKQDYAYEIYIDGPDCTVSRFGDTQKQILKLEGKNCPGRYSLDPRVLGCEQGISVENLLKNYILESGIDENYNRFLVFRIKPESSFTGSCKSKKNQEVYSPDRSYITARDYDNKKETNSLLLRRYPDRADIQNLPPREEPYPLEASNARYKMGQRVIAKAKGGRELEAIIIGLPMNGKQRIKILENDAEYDWNISAIKFR